MPRYLCPSCHDVTEPSGASRYAWCTACGQPLSLFDLLPVRPGVPAQRETQSDAPPTSTTQLTSR